MKQGIISIYCNMYNMYSDNKKYAVSFIMEMQLTILILTYRNIRLIFEIDSCIS